MLLHLQTGGTYFHLNEICTNAYSDEYLLFVILCPERLKTLYVLVFV